MASSPIKKRQQQRLVGLLVLVILLGGLGFYYRGALWSGLSFVQRPLTSTAEWIQSKIPGRFAGEVSSERIEELKRQRDAYAIERGELARLRLENQQLKEQLSYVERSGHEHLSSAIIARDVSKQMKRFIIDRGESDGVKVGSPVVVENGVIMGKVVSVTAHTATVQAVNDPKSRIAGTLLNETRTLGIVKGTTGNLLELELVPQDEIINVDDLVTTSGLDDSVPSGLVIGRVNAVRQETGTPFQTAIIEPMIDPQYYRIVSVLIPQS